jgi:hypothetical protein
MPKYRPLVSIPEFGPDAVCADHARQPLLDWRAAVAARGGTLEANSLTRTCAQQQKLRNAYVNWLNAGKPNPPVAAANKPGRSGHQGGISIDAKTRGAFPKEPLDQQIDLLWETGRPFGWTPIIAIPDENASERWHFDAFLSWSSVRAHRTYDETCLCSALDVGQAGEWQSDDRLLQALLLRAGFDIGELDGIWGSRSSKAINMAIGAIRSDPVEQTADRLRSLQMKTDWIVVR